MDIFRICFNSVYFRVVKSGTQRQRKSRKKLKENAEKYKAHLDKERQRNKARRMKNQAELAKDKVKLKEKRKKDAERQRKHRARKKLSLESVKATPESSTSSLGTYRAIPLLEKAAFRYKKNQLKSPGKRSAAAKKFTLEPYRRTSPRQISPKVCDIVKGCYQVIGNIERMLTNRSLAQLVRSHPYKPKVEGSIPS